MSNFGMCQLLVTAQYSPVKRGPSPTACQSLGIHTTSAFVVGTQVAVVIRLRRSLTALGLGQASGHAVRQ